MCSLLRIKFRLWIQSEDCYALVSRTLRISGICIGMMEVMSLLSLFLGDFLGKSNRLLAALLGFLRIPGSLLMFPGLFPLIYNCRDVKASLDYF